MLRFFVVLGLSGWVGCGCGDDDGGTDAGDVDGAMGDGGPGMCTVRAVTIEGATEQPAAPHGIGGNMDLAIENDRVRAVFAAIDRPAFYAASGGTLVDFHPIGRGDALNEFSQLGGAAQALQVRYTSMEIAEQDETHVIVQMTGHVQQTPPEAGDAPAISPDPGTDLEMVTRYELRCGEPILHITSTVTNNTPNTYAPTGGFFPMDLLLWGGTSSTTMSPFCPETGQGDRCRVFSFADPLGTLVPTEWVGTTGAYDGEALSYAIWPEDPGVATLNGVHSPTVSSVGDFMTTTVIVNPGFTKTHRRALAVGGRADTASSLDHGLEALAAQGRFELSTVTGQVVMPAGETIPEDEFARPLVLIAEPPPAGDATNPLRWRPITMVRVDADGRFTARVRAERISWELRVRGRAPKRGEGGMAPAGETLDLGMLMADPGPVLTVTVRDLTSGTPAPMPARVVVVAGDPMDNPEFGPRQGGSPAGNMALTDDVGEVVLPILPGEYDVYATHGMGWSLAHERVTVGAAGAEVTLDLQELPVFPADFVTADFHVHSGISFDSSLPVDDRVRAFLAEGVEAIVATEHDVIFDYAPALASVEMGLPAAWQGRMRTFVGVESTNNVPQPSFPHTMGHYNGFPIFPTFGAHKNGAPDDEYISVPELFDAIRAINSPADPLVQINHARAERAGLVWLGYFDSCGFVPTEAFDPMHRCWSAMSAAGTRPWDFDAFELINGKGGDGYLQNIRDWSALLRYAPGGRLPVGTANSDSHELVTGHAGWPVTVLNTSTALASIDDSELVSTLQSGSVAGALGVFVWATARETAVGMTEVGPGTMPLRAMTGLITLHITVNAAPWVPVEEIRIRAGGEIIQRIPAAMLMGGGDPFGTTGVTRFDADVPLLTAFTADTFITVEAGIATPAVADLDGDGVIDQSDRDGDGDADMADMTMAAGVEIPLPTGPIAAVAAGAHPVGFTNPIFIDVDGDATYDPPMSPLPE